MEDSIKGEDSRIDRDGTRLSEGGVVYSTGVAAWTTVGFKNVYVMFAVLVEYLVADEHISYKAYVER